MGGGGKRLFEHVQKNCTFLAGNPSEKISKVMMEKNLRLNEDKCVVITIGTKNIERKQRFS